MSPGRPPMLLAVALAAAAASCADASPPAERSAAAPADGARASDAPVATAAPPASPPAPEPVAASATTTACNPAPDVAIFASPRSPWPGAPLRFVAFTERAFEGALAVRAPDGSEAALSRERHGGPPYWWFAEVSSPSPGTYRARLSEGAAARACIEQEVAAQAPPRPARGWGAIWRVRGEWTREMEALYSVWIEKLFDAPLDEQPSWPALHDVLRQPGRNLLHDHLGGREDAPAPMGLVVDPDCADLPYFLRAYFAFKLGLPFGYSSCSRGGANGAPRCFRWHTNLENVKSRRPTPADAFGDFLRVRLADSVHSGTGRTAGDDDRTDYYPVALRAESLRPGAIFADPYGHILVVAKRVPQTASSGGVLLAVDGQPDGTVSRRRFWRGNFLFAVDPALGGPGFKRFRPVVSDGGKLRTLKNDEIAQNPIWGDYSLEQYELGVEGFYDRMDDLLSPEPLDPERALRETIVALEEQVRGRVVSVDNGEKYFAGGGSRIDMPEGAAVFETTGPWEDFSTPSRDLRLLIALDVVRGFSERVARRPSRFSMPAGRSAADVRTELDAILQSELARRTFTYRRSDGSPFSLSLADVLERAAALEMAYNPNDCVERRWGASDGGDEAKPCKRRAPADQTAKMRDYRSWFSGRRRPPRP